MSKINIPLGDGSLGKKRSVPNNGIRYGMRIQHKVAGLLPTKASETTEGIPLALLRHNL